MTTEYLAVIAFIALFIALYIIYRMFRLCNELRRLLLAEYSHRREVFTMMRQYEAENESLRIANAEYRRAAFADPRQEDD